MSKLLKYIGDNQGLNPFLYQNTIPSDYIEITDMLEFYENSTVIGKDYKYIRAKLKELYTAKGWDNCTEEEKYFVCSRFIERDKTRQLSLLTINEYKAFAKTFDVKSQECRSGRREAVRVEILGYIGANEGLALLNQDKVKKVYDLYIQGIEFFDEDGQTGLIDYFNSEHGFTGDGFREDLINFGYTVDPQHTVNSLIALANDILIDGNY